uniref:Type III-B CRISPR-associated protein Cas10/Cmr2 n=1 Tax=Desulfatirhabdium butyrativorans TaxID=340467 RepID=A0A7C4RTM0_9BACT
MSQYLIEVTIGPVQSFIAAARRSRDLWAGSYMLSKMVRAVGKCLLDRNATLIYPAEERVRKLQPEENSNLPNIVLALLEAEGVQQVKDTANAAKDAAKKRLSDFAETAWKKWTDSGVPLRKAFWDRQIDTAIECFAAWSLLPEEEGADYRLAYDRLKMALASRKNTRDFEPIHTSQTHPMAADGVPKSSLDGLRESVLPKGRMQFPLRFGLSSGEQLDALGAIKRVEGRKERFVALSRVAADAWLGKLSDRERNQLKEVYDPLVSSQVATKSLGNGDIYQDFPYDAGLLYPERLEIAWKEAAQDQDQAQAEAIRNQLKQLRETLKPLWKKHGRPCPYVAMILADGDRMGKFVDAAKTLENHAAVSQAVCAFADGVPEILRNHRGQCIYNGGDDLMGILPLGSLLDAGQALSQAFSKALQDVIQHLLGPNPKSPPTLRLGAAICHILEPLGYIRRWAADAEHFAKSPEAEPKRQGNALGLCLHIRSGHTVSIRLPFNDSDAFGALELWMDGYKKDRLPGRLAFDTAAIFEGVDAGRFTGPVAKAEWHRLLDRARQSGGQKALTEEFRIALIERLQVLEKQEGYKSAFRRLADELRMARWLSATTEADITYIGG